MKADEINAALQMLLAGEKPQNAQEAEALVRAVQLKLFETGPVSAESLDRIERHKRRLKWWRRFWQRRPSKS